MKKYKQLTLGLRYQIFAYKEENYSISKIARVLDFNKSTISREIKRNSSDGYYSPEYAEIQAASRDIKKRTNKKLNNKIKLLIGKKLRENWSPEQIAGKLKKDKIANISHETIYRYIYKNQRNGGKLFKWLRHQNKKYKNRSELYRTRGQIRNRVNISQRSVLVNRKVRFGDFEVDTVIGKNYKGALVTLVDRNSKFTLIKKVDSKYAHGVTQAIIEMLRPIKSLIHTITTDNGKEFSYHEEIAKELNIKFYFCDPYASWQRGLNEHTNELIREYIPKKSEFDRISRTEIVHIKNRLNNRPRKVLEYKTPNEIFFNILQRKLSA
ncbi:MAG: IS30 family transposase [Campylobacteraceae bacterium]|nr:IS30 family transposase [Campylobacteraceae bacterium]